MTEDYSEKTETKINERIGLQNQMNLPLAQRVPLYRRILERLTNIIHRGAIQDKLIIDFQRHIAEEAVQGKRKKSSKKCKKCKKCKKKSRK
jgi:hypothetical protein